MPKTQTPSQDLISCIMPTADRPHHAIEAIGFFLAQDYPNRELIVIDDGEKQISGLIPHDSRIRYRYLPQKHKLGAKRNMACDMARGQWIAHWDDDDWHAPWRLSYQAEQMREGRWDLCGLSRLFFLDAECERAWQYNYPEHARPWVAGGTLFYRKSYWRDCPFREIDVGEDALFVWRQPVPRIKKLQNADFYVARIHAGNTSPKLTHGSCWQAVDPAMVRKLVGYGWPIRAWSLNVPDSGNSDFDSNQQEPVLVSIPYFGCRKYLRRAVESILAQSYRNLTVVVLNDGDEPPWDLLSGIDDPRLLFFDLAENRGRYFADAVAVEAAAGAGLSYVLIQDADDWSEPDRLENLMACLKSENVGGAVSSNWTHVGENGRARSVERAGDLKSPLGPTMEHRVNHYGLFRVDALVAVGGYYGGFRIGYDTLLLNFLQMTAGLAVESRPLYHRSMRAHSLTSAPDTGMASPLRRETAAKLARMYAEAYRHYKRHQDGTISIEELCGKIRIIAARNVGEESRAALKAESKRLQNPIEERIEGSAVETILPDQSDKLIDLHHPELDWSVWTLDKATVRELRDRLDISRPRRIIEAGSGLSTLFLAEYCRGHNAELISLEHDPSYYRSTRRLLTRFHLERFVDLRLVPLRPIPCGPGRSHPWYDTILDGYFDFALVDGPPMGIGRQATLFALHPHLAPGWEMWLDDADRDHERQCLALWQRHFPEIDILHRPSAKGLAQISPCPEGAVTPGPDTSLPEKLGITLLTGGRPDLLRETLTCLETHHPELLSRSPFLVLVNGKDPEAMELLRQKPYIDAIENHAGQPLPIGPAVSRLMASLKAWEDLDIVLHLEDDWLAEPGDRDWLHRGLTLLRAHPAVGQVRLRLSRERTLPFHMITGKPIQWRRHCGFHMAPSAHFTFNPSLVRMKEVRKIYPCESERQAQIHFLESGLATAQLVPGVFRHGGEGKSRRLALGR